MDYYLAVDLGASSGRLVLGHIENNKIMTEEIYRFVTHGKQKGDKWAWDCNVLVENIIIGMEMCKQQGKIPKMIGIDTWGADYVLLDKEGEVLCNASDYRDEMAFFGMMLEADRIIPYAEYYQRTGIGRLPIDTIYQLMALQSQHPEVLEKAGSLLMISTFINYKLTGVIKEEYTTAVTTGLINAKTQTWDMETIERIGFPADIFTKLYAPGEIVGRLCESVKRRVGFDCDVVLPASHDTSSAFLAVPSTDKDSVSVSNGTWSIIGIISEQPINTPSAMAAGFTNEGAYPKRYRLSKNIVGMFMLEMIRTNLGGNIRYDELIKMAENAGNIQSVIDMSNLMYLLATDMIAAIKDDCSKSGQQVPQTSGEVLKVFFQSLAAYYARAIRELEEIMGKKFTALNIVGGGSRNDYMNKLVAKTISMPVIAGPAEATILGNLMCQMIAGREFPDIDAAKSACAESFPVKHFS